MYPAIAHPKTALILIMMNLFQVFGVTCIESSSSLFSKSYTVDNVTIESVPVLFD